MNPTCTPLQNGNANSKQLYWPAASMSFIKHAAPIQSVSSTSSNLHSQNVCKESFGKKESVAIRFQPALFASLIPHHSACNTRQVHNLMRPRTFIGRTSLRAFVGEERRHRKCCRAIKDTHNMFIDGPDFVVGLICGMHFVDRIA